MSETKTSPRGWGSWCCCARLAAAQYEGKSSQIQFCTIKSKKGIQKKQQRNNEEDGKSNKRSWRSGSPSPAARSLRIDFPSALLVSLLRQTVTNVPAGPPGQWDVAIRSHCPSAGKKKHFFFLQSTAGRGGFIGSNLVERVYLVCLLFWPGLLEALGL